MRPALPAKVGERLPGAIPAHDYVGEVDRAAAVAGPVQNRCGQKPQHAGLFLQEANIGESAQEGDVDRGLP